jgi:ATP-dependent RNA helicase RhlE
VDALVDKLQGLGINADGIHGDKPQATRQRALDRFKASEVQILVATDVAARGLDIEDLPLVINFDLPIVAEDYIHRIGRTGRAGNTGEAISLVCADEVNMLSSDVDPQDGAGLRTGTPRAGHRCQRAGGEEAEKAEEAKSFRWWR